MISNAIQQGDLRHVAKQALNLKEYQESAVNVRQMFDDMLPWTGVRAQVAPQLINQFYFSTSRPGMGQNTLIPVGMEHPSNRIDLHDPTRDPMQTAWAWTKQLIDDQSVRGDQAFIQQQPMIPVVVNRAFANSITRELHHPLTGESTNFINFAYMPQYATVKQQQIALHNAQAQGAVAHRRNLGGDKYWRNPNQSFRYQVRQQ